MAAPEPAVPLTRALHALRERVSNTTLRSVSEEVGLSHRGLSKLLEGTRPQGRTLEKLAKWYRNHAVPESSARIVDALDTLLAGMPESARFQARRRTAKFITQIYGEVGRAPPDGLAREAQMTRDDGEGSAVHTVMPYARGPERCSGPRRHLPQCTES